MQRVAASHGGQFVSFFVEQNPVLNKDQAAGSDEVVHVLNGKYYKTSETLYYENLAYITRGFNNYIIPVTVDPPIVGPEDSHMNEHATDQVIKDLAAKIENLVPAKP
jgi:hypothetical protein